MNKEFKIFLVILQSLGVYQCAIVYLIKIKKIDVISLIAVASVIILNAFCITMLILDERKGIVSSILNFILQSIYIGFPLFKYFYFTFFSFYIGIVNNKFILKFYFGGDLSFKIGLQRENLGIAFNVFAIGLLFVMFYELGKMSCKRTEIIR